MVKERSLACCSSGGSQKVRHNLVTEQKQHTHTHTHTYLLIYPSIYLNLEPWFSLVSLILVQHGKFPHSLPPCLICNFFLLGSERSSGGGNGNPFQYFSWKTPLDKRSLEGYSQWCRKESDMTEWPIHTHTHTHILSHSLPLIKITHSHYLWSRHLKKIHLFNRKLITLQYCSGFCHALIWISHGCTCVPHPEPPSLLPHHLSPQCTGFECPVSCIKLGLVIYFTYGHIHVSVLFSQITPPSPSPTESTSLFFTSVSLLLSRI